RSGARGARAAGRVRARLGPERVERDRVARVGVDRDDDPVPDREEEQLVDVEPDPVARAARAVEHDGAARALEDVDQLGSVRAVAQAREGAEEADDRPAAAVLSGEPAPAPDAPDRVLGEAVAEREPVTPLERVEDPPRERPGRLAHRASLPPLCAAPTRSGWGSNPPPSAATIP